MLTNLVGRYWGRAKNLHKRTMQRALVVGMMLLYLGSMHAAGWLMLSQWTASVWILVSAAALLLMSVAFASPHSNFRSLLSASSIFPEYVFLTGLLLAGGISAAPFSMLLLWLAIDYGQRCGPKYFVLGGILGGCGMLTLLAFSDYWHDQRVLGIGILLGVITIPVYLSRIFVGLIGARDAASRAGAAGKDHYLESVNAGFRASLSNIFGTDSLNDVSQPTAKPVKRIVAMRNINNAFAATARDRLDAAILEMDMSIDRRTEFSLDKLLDNVVSTLQGQAHEKGLTLRIDNSDHADGPLCGDFVQLRRILVHLVHNAIKFTEDGGITIFASSSEADRQTRLLHLEVRDSGPGIPAHARQHILDGFEQGDFGTVPDCATFGRPTQEWGDIVSIQDGSHGGTCIALTLAIRRGKVMPSVINNVVSIDDPFVRHRKRVASLSILLADSDTGSRFALHELLEKSGHRCEEVADGKMLVMRMLGHQHDLVLLDSNLQQMPDAETFNRLRMTQTGAQRPVIVLAGEQHPSDCHDALFAHGPVSILRRPVAIIRLLDAIANCASGKPAVDVSRATKASLEDPVIAPDMLRELLALGLGGDFLAQFTDDSLRDIDIALNQVIAAANSSDRNSLREASHAMKSIAMHLGARRLASACNESARLPAGADARVLRDHAAMLHRMVVEVRAQLPGVLNGFCLEDDSRDSEVTV